MLFLERIVRRNRRALPQRRIGAFARRDTARRSSQDQSDALAPPALTRRSAGGCYLLRSRPGETRLPGNPFRSGGAGQQHLTHHPQVRRGEVFGEALFFEPRDPGEDRVQHLRRMEPEAVAEGNAGDRITWATKHVLGVAHHSPSVTGNPETPPHTKHTEASENAGVLSGRRPGAEPCCESR